MKIRDPGEIDRERQAIENEADVLMQEVNDIAPVDLARELMAKRGTIDMQPEIIPLVAEVLRGRQAEWLRGRRWPAKAAIPGRPELERTSDHAQPVAPDDIDQGVFTRES